MDKPIFLNKKDFIDSFKLVPRLAINLIIKKENKILLLKRNTSPFKNQYHFPGSFILKNEKIKNTIIRILKNELFVNINDFNKFKLIFVGENIDGDPRGHIIDIFYLIEDKKIIDLINKKNTKWLSLKDFKKFKLGFKQEKYLEVLKKFL